MTQANALRVTNLTKKYGGLVVTDAISLGVHTGEVHAVIGPNGAGKTTLLAQLAGAIEPDAGSIELHGRDITRLPQHARVRLGLARSHQITSIFRTQTVLENLCLAVQRRRTSPYSFWKHVSADRIEEEAQAIAAEVGLAGLEGHQAGTLAHGRQRQVEIALALASGATVLLLDEPMAGVSNDEAHNITRLIQGMKGRLTVVLVEHDMHAVFALADRISVLVNGRLIATGSRDEIRNHPEVRRAYLGDEAVA
ncbi:MAG TPA: ABC transporter ATP-binding protein [Ramlibacter sp.]|jgi:branched-chain amino acid transport system ATP-binding protein|nr:ABC transporter ATP-binding protein [Ramlibacter sp.]